MEKIAPYGKAIVGALLAALASWQQALDGDNHVSQNEWISIVVAFLVAGGVVFAVPNKDPQAIHQDESVQPPQAGYGALELLIGVVVLVILILVLVRLA